jgi:ribosomal protein S12 methylthiotransferase accessory factor
MMLAYERALARMAPLVDDKTGIVARAEVLRISENDPAIFLAHAEPADTTALSGLRAANRGAACSISRQRAVLRACGECVERYCASFIDLRRLRLATPNQLRSEGARWVHPCELYPFSPAQYDQPGFPYQAVSNDTGIRWSQATVLGSDEKVWVPASCVFVPYLFDSAVEPFTHMPISTGLAAHGSVAAAIAKGVLEILERDALMIAWQSSLAMPRIDVDSCRGVSPEVARLLAAGEHGPARWFLNCLTLDMDVPVICAALIDAGTPPKTSFGIAAEADPERALVLALEEALLTRVLLNRMVEVDTASQVTPLELATLRGHLLAHAKSAELRQALRFLTDEGPLVDFTAIKPRAASPEPAALLEGSGLEALWVDVTTPDVADLDLHVVRVLVPGAQPLDNDHRHRYLGGKRLSQVPRKLGYALPADWNENPHPFP